MTDPKTSFASYTTSGGLILFGISANDFALLCGIAFAFLTFLINWYYKHKHLALLQQKVDALPFPELQQESDE